MGQGHYIASFGGGGGQAQEHQPAVKFFKKNSHLTKRFNSFDSGVSVLHERPVALYKNAQLVFCAEWL